MKLSGKMQLMMLLLIILASCAGTKQITTNDIFQKNLAAKGGEKYSSVKTMQVDCSMDVMGMSIPMKLYMITPSKMRMEISMMGQDIVTVFDGKEGWILQNGEVTDLESDQLGELENQLNGQFGVFYNDYSNAKNYVYAGLDTLDSKEVYSLKNMREDSTYTMLYIETKTNLEYGGTQEFNMMGNTSELTYYVKEFKDVEGIKLPSLISFEAGEAGSFEMKANSFVLNENLGASLFRKPE